MKHFILLEVMKPRFPEDGGRRLFIFLVYLLLNRPVGLWKCLWLSHFGTPLHMPLHKKGCLCARGRQ